MLYGKNGRLLQFACRFDPGSAIFVACVKTARLIDGAMNVCKADDEAATAEMYCTPTGRSDECVTAVNGGDYSAIRDGTEKWIRTPRPRSHGTPHCNPLSLSPYPSTRSIAAGQRGLAVAWLRRAAGVQSRREAGLLLLLALSAEEDSEDDTIATRHEWRCCMQESRSCVCDIRMSRRRHRLSQTVDAATASAAESVMWCL